METSPALGVAPDGKLSLPLGEVELMETPPLLPIDSVGDIVASLRGSGINGNWMEKMLNAMELCRSLPLGEVELMETSGYLQCIGYVHQVASLRGSGINGNSNRSLWEQKAKSRFP